MTPEEIVKAMARLRAILRPAPYQRFKAMSLRELDEQVKFMETTPWEPDLVAELNEKRYREGYRDGFIAALEAYYEPTQGVETPESTRHAQRYRRLFDYWNRTLARWAHADCSKRTHFGVNERPFEDGGDLPPMIGEK